MKSKQRKASNSDKRLVRHYRKLCRAAGLTIEETLLPRDFRDSVECQSRKGRLGRIVVKKMTGLQPSSASKTMLKLQNKIGEGFRDEIAEKLEAIEPSLNKETKNLLALLKSPGTRNKSLARLVAESGADPAQVIRKYADGAIELGKLEVAIEAHQNMPLVVRDLVRHSLDQQGICRVCGGLGTLEPRVKREGAEPMKCSTCSGTGVNLEPSAHKQFAVEKLMEITDLVRSKAPQQVVNVGIQTNVGKDHSFMEKITKIGENVIFKREPRKIEAPVVEAEIVES